MKRSDKKIPLIDGVAELPIGAVAGIAGLRSEETETSLAVGIAEKGMIEQVVHVGPSAKSRTVSIHTGAGSRSRFLIAPQASGTRFEFTLDPYSYADIFFESPDALAEARYEAVSHLKKHSSLNVWTVTLERSVEWDHTIHFEEPHGFAAFWGLSVADGDTQVTHRLKALHEAAHCTSRQFYKYILGGSARTSFESLVSVFKDADKSDSRQLNKNLLLSRKAKASSKPELRIDADDVSASHGSATGELSDESIFYLQSRGIAKELARTVLVHGFASEILSSMPAIGVRAAYEDRVREKVARLAGRM